MFIIGFASGRRHATFDSHALPPDCGDALED
jgi:hypothetical protein